MKEGLSRRATPLRSTCSSRSRSRGRIQSPTRGRADTQGCRPADDRWGRRRGKGRTDRQLTTTIIPPNPTLCVRTSACLCTCLLCVTVNNRLGFSDGGESTRPDGTKSCRDGRTRKGQTKRETTVSARGSEGRCGQAHLDFRSQPRAMCTLDPARRKGLDTIKGRFASKRPSAETGKMRR